MKSRIVLAGALLLASAVPSLGQELPPGKWWHHERMVRELGLTADQRQALDDVFRATASELIDLKAEVDKRAVALRATLDRPVLDRAAVQRAAAEVSAARARLFERELMMLVDMRGVLDEAQWNRFRAAIEQHHRRRMQPDAHHGPPDPSRSRPGARRRP